MFSLIVAIDRNNGISKNGQIPWKIKEDLKHFKEITTKCNSTDSDSVSRNAVLFGRKTYESIGHPLKDRLNIVISKNPKPESFTDQNLIYFNNLNQAIRYCQVKRLNVYICGGRTIYETFNTLNLLSNLYITYLDLKYETDNILQINLNKEFLLTQKYRILDEKEVTGTDSSDPEDLKQITFKFIHYHKNLEELQYNELLDQILRYGVLRGNRTNISAVSDFGKRLEFSLRDNILPLLTCKKVSFKTILAELLWFISGSTNSKILENQGIKIWQGNSSSEYLERLNLPYEEGDIGPGYGFQWRYAGAPYHGCHETYTGQGVDQLSNLIQGLKNDPYGRRHIISAWNVAQLPEMALPPCHLLLQLYVTEFHDQTSGKVLKYLSGQLYQRSADAFLGVPFNIASYAILIMLIAQTVNMLPDKLIMIFGDFHIYKNHQEKVFQLLEKTPYQFPTLKINPNTNLFTAKMDDFEVLNYQSYGIMKAEMAV